MSRSGLAGRGVVVVEIETNPERSWRWATKVILGLLRGDDQQFASITVEEDQLQTEMAEAP